ncbi:MAG: Asp-tRNA(Asn)/Glu-tRNA(Gln) amidotransferase subunit GatC [Chloroflexi bacterium]|nr:Asp-tRNA(Asn)/Glu-tRNA(Gln) amidotransferase subunit GatC [Chloroflexota bacterium]
MRLTRDDVLHVAYLARLGLADADVALLQDQLSNILQQFEILNRLDVSGISPTAQVITVQNVMRDDRARPSWPREAILANAPRREDDFFRVKAVLEGQEPDL